MTRYEIGWSDIETCEQCGNNLDISELEQDKAGDYICERCNKLLEGE